MKILSPAISRLARLRMYKMARFIEFPVDTQKMVLQDLIKHGKSTEFGKQYHFKRIHSINDFQEAVPIQNYNHIKPYVDRIINGEQNLLWDTAIKWFAKSSGTTNEKSKFIPVSKESLRDCHYRAGRDVLTLFYNNYPDSDLLTGKSLVIGGSHQVSKMNELISYGDLSAVTLQNLPFYGQLLRTPELSVALMDEWEKKIDVIARETIKENVTSLVGVPTWTLILIKRILELTGKEKIKEVWPNLELYIHGGVSFTPYVSQFEKLIDDPTMKYLETYNASEGFFAAQDACDCSEGMLLFLDHGIFYEFMPLSELNAAHPNSLTLEEVELGQTYALIISTNSGLWRYQIGDTIEFTSLSPFRIKVKGRTKSFINVFGEELIVDNTDKAIAAACQQTQAVINDYTVGPIYFSEAESGAHEWLIEFDKEPSNKKEFKEILDQRLKEVNSDYEAKRYKDIALLEPVIHFLPKGTFIKWLKGRNKLGGQHKVPRLYNERKFIDEILSLVNEC